MAALRSSVATGWHISAGFGDRTESSILRSNPRKKASIAAGRKPTVFEMACLRHARSKFAVSWIGITVDHRDDVNEVAQVTGQPTHARQAASNHLRNGHQLELTESRIRHRVARDGVRRTHPDYQHAGGIAGPTFVTLVTPVGPGCAGSGRDTLGLLPGLLQGLKVGVTANDFGHAGPIQLPAHVIVYFNEHHAYILLAQRARD